MKTTIILILFATLGLSACKNEQEVAEEKNKEVLKKMFDRPPQKSRTYQQIQEDNKKRRDAQR